MVGMAGLERATFSSQSCRATKLRHIPLVLKRGSRTRTQTVFETAALTVGLIEYNLAAPPGFEPGISYFKGRDVASYTTGQ